jgi:hypothetical protein
MEANMHDNKDFNLGRTYQIGLVQALLDKWRQGGEIDLSDEDYFFINRMLFAQMDEIKTPARLDPAGNPVLQANMLEQHMAQALNSVKAWADTQPPIPFPWGVRESVEAVLMAYEIRRRP